MKYRKILDVPKNYPFGIEIEIANKCVMEIDKMIRNHFDFIPIIGKTGLLFDDSGIDYDYFTKNKFIFACPWDETSKWHYFYENVNGNHTSLGVEISSPILYNNSKDFKSMETVFYSLQNISATVNENCGAHIHFGSAIFQKSFQKLFSYFLFYLLFEPVFYKFSAMGEFGHIRNSCQIFAKPISNQIPYQNLSPKTLEQYIKENQSAYEKRNALHFKGFQINCADYGSSFELRVFNGSLDENIWQNYINFCLSFLFFSLNNNLDQSKLLKRVQQELKLRRDWNTIGQYISYADCLVEEMVSYIFSQKIDQDYFYEQYSGDYIRKRKAIA